MRVGETPPHRSMQIRTKGVRIRREVAGDSPETTHTGEKHGLATLKQRMCERKRRREKSATLRGRS